MRILVFIAALLSAASARAHAAPPSHPSPSDPELERCLAVQTAQAGVDQVTACYTAALSRTDAQIAEAAPALRKRAAERKLDGEVGQALAGWQVYRDRWCAFEERFEGDAGARQSTGLMCRYELGRAQLARIRNAN